MNSIQFHLRNPEEKYSMSLSNVIKKVLELFLNSLQHIFL